MAGTRTGKTSHFLKNSLLPQPPNIEAVLSARVAVYA